MSNGATWADIVAMCPEPLAPGRQTLHVLDLTATGGRFRLHVRNSRGQPVQLSLGTGAALTRRLRVLLGAEAPGPHPTLEQVREALVGRSFHVRLTEENYNGYDYLEIRRA